MPSGTTALAHDVKPASLCEGPFFYFYVVSVYLLLSILEANTCVKFVHHFLYACLLNLLYCFVLTIIHEIYMLKLKAIAET